jgi:uncharacterized protein (DUF4213/DUF364 family)
MSLLDDLLATLPDAPVRAVLVGVHWTAVCSRGCGLASTIPGDGPHGHAAVRDVGRLHRKSARELAEYARSGNTVEAGVGVAAINSLLDLDESSAVEVNASRVLAERGRGRSVAIVGSFPFIPRLREQVGELWVLEQRPSEGEHPAAEAERLIPRADVVAITGSALVNGTLDGLLALCRPESLVMVLGPRTRRPFSARSGRGPRSGRWRGCASSLWSGLSGRGASRRPRLRERFAIDGNAHMCEIGSEGLGVDPLGEGGRARMVRVPARHGEPGGPRPSRAA